MKRKAIVVALMKKKLIDKIEMEEYLTPKEIELMKLRKGEDIEYSNRDDRGLIDKKKLKEIKRKSTLIEELNTLEKMNNNRKRSIIANKMPKDKNLKECEIISDKDEEDSNENNSKKSSKVNEKKQRKKSIS